MKRIAQGDLGVNRTSDRIVAQPHISADLHAANARLLQRRQAIANAAPLRQPIAFTWPTRADRAPGPPPQPATVPCYPDIAVAALRRRESAVTRVWLLCRWLDVGGRGWLPLSAIRETLSNKKSRQYIGGKRRLRTLLRAGEGRYWQRDGHDRLWLRSALRVAEVLKIGRLTAAAVELPLAALSADIGTVRAHFYATFHSSRRSRPLTRATITQLTGVPERTQRDYEARTGITVTHTIAIGERLTKTNIEQRALVQGRALFTFTDHQGKRGEAGQRWLAWHLPNRYSGVHKRCARGRLRKINRQLRQLTDLVEIRAQGNGQPNTVYSQIFFENGHGAVCATKGHDRDRYWPQATARSGTGLWNVLAQSNCVDYVKD